MSGALPLLGLRVVELVGSPAGGYAGRLLAGLGAEVVAVRDRSGREPGLPEGGVQDTGTRALNRFLATDKRSLEIDSETSDGRSQLVDLLRGADAVIESSAPEPLHPRSLDLVAAQENPGLVRVHLSPFGSTGPRAGYLSNEFTDEAWGGHLFLNGDPEREPVGRPGFHAHFQAGTYGVIGLLSAWIARSRGAPGQVVEVSHLGGLASLHQYSTVMWSQAQHVLHRVGNRQGGHWHPVGIYRCRDGYVSLAMPSSEMVLPFLEEAGLREMASDERFTVDFVRGQHKDEFDAELGPWLATVSVEEVLELGRRTRAPVGPVISPLGLLRDEHLKERRYLRRESDGVLVPRLPMVFRAQPDQPFGEAREAADPERGAAGILGTEAASSTARGAGGTTRAATEATGSEPSGHDDSMDGPLSGFRVLDLTRVWAGPLATRILGDLGADVIKVEACWSRGPAEQPPEAGRATHSYPEEDVGDQPYNREISFNKLNRNKRGITLELDRPLGRETFLELARHADLVIENFSPRVMGKLGLGPRELRGHRPDLVTVAMSGFGSTGPYRDLLAFGPLIEGMSGISEQLGYPDSGPYRSGLAWADPVTALHAAAGVCAALLARERGQAAAQHVEVAMMEAMASFGADALVAAQLRGEDAPRRGNRHPTRIPQGCYPCLGRERWVAISVENDEQWRGLVESLALPADWSSWAFEERRDGHDEIDGAIEDRLATERREAVVERLQAFGVPAAVVADAKDVFDDGQLAAEDFWAVLDHREVGRRSYPGLPIRLEKTPVTYRRPAPCLGQHGEEVLRELLGWEEDRIQRLRADGHLLEVPPEGATMRGRGDRPKNNG